jgi:hypothetical protein
MCVCVPVCVCVNARACVCTGGRLHVLTLEDDEKAEDKGAVMFVGHQIIEASGALQEQVRSLVWV